MEQAAQALARGDYFEAANVYSSLLQDNPNDVNLLMKRADSYKEMQSFKKAILDYTTILQHDSQNVEALAKRAVCFMEIEKYQPAVQDIELTLHIAKTKDIKNKWIQLASSQRSQARSLAHRQSQMPQEEFDEYYLTLYRIHLDGPLPSDIKFDQFYDIRVVISNEFWLFRSKDLYPYYPVNLEFSVVEVQEETGSWVENDRFRVKVHQDDKAIIPRDQRDCHLRIAVSLVDGAEKKSDKFSSKAWGKSLFIKIVASGEDSQKHIIGVLCLVPASLQDDADPLAHVATYRWMPIQSTHLIIRELPDAIGTKIWDCAIFLTRYLEDRARIFPNFLRGKRVVEMGSGTGLVGLACRVLGADVTMSELDEVLQNLHANLKINRHICAESDSAEAASKSMRATMLEWGKEPDQETTLLKPPYEWIVASDIIYELVVIEDLVKSMVALSGPGTNVLLAYRNRGLSEEREAVVFAEFEKYFDVQPAPGVNPAILYNAKIFSMTRKSD